MSTTVAARDTVGIGARCTGVVHIYRAAHGEVVALRGVDLDVAPGESVGLLGPSGAGKSTVLALLAGLLRPSAGQIRVGDTDLARLGEADLLRLRSTTLGVVPQDPLLLLLPYATALDNVRASQRSAPRDRRRTLPRPAALLDRLGLGELARRRVAHLSGGERKRVALAVGVARTPGLLLVDEPTSQLDTAGRDAVVAMLSTIHRELGSTVVAVTHDPSVAGAMERTVTIRDGRVGAEGRRGEEYAVVGADGSVQLPPDVLDRLPPGTLLRVVRQPSGVDLRAAEEES